MISAHPKIELHVHLEGTIRPATLLDIARRNGETLPADTEEDLARLYTFRDFAHFIEVWIMTTNCLRGREDFREVAVAYAAEAAAHGATYVEGIFSAAERVERGLAWDDVFGGYCDAVAQARDEYGLELRFDVDLYRGLDPALAEECARVAVRYRDRGVVGLGIGGNERASGLDPYRRAFDIARDGGLALVPHAGESGGAESVREALRYDVRRIRHGIRAVDDPDLLAEIAERGIVLDVCPTSNLRTGVVGDVSEHPLPRLREAGVRCTVNTDDPAMFGTDLSQEYAIAQRLGLDGREIYAAGLAGAACDEQTRQRLRLLAGAGADAGTPR